MKSENTNIIDKGLNWRNLFLNPLSSSYDKSLYHFVVKTADITILAKTIKAA